MTLTELSRRTGLSVSYLSEVERGKSSLYLTSLKSIVDALGISMSDILEDLDTSSYVYSKKDEALIRLEKLFFPFSRMSGNFKNRKMEWLKLSLAPGKTTGEATSHIGEEGYYIIEGSAVFYLNGVKHVLEEGDTIHFPSKLVHSIENNSTDKELRMLCVITPPLF